MSSSDVPAPAPDPDVPPTPDADGAEPTSTTTPTPEGRHPVLVYTGLRILLFLAVGAVLFLLGLRGVWLLLFAILISGVISAVALNRVREGAAFGITNGFRKLNRRIEDSARAEDVDTLDDDLAEEPPASDTAAARDAAAATERATESRD